MQSSWEVIYTASHTNVFMRKLNHYLDVDTAVVFSERLNLYDRKMERTVFRIDHPANTWSELLLDVVKLGARLSNQWTISCNDTADSHICAQLDVEERENSGGFFFMGPSGLKKISWTIQADQNYREIESIR